MRSLPYMALLFAACSFDASTSGVLLDADPNAPDADPNAPDANAPDADPFPFCGWGYEPVHFSACPSPAAPFLPLNLFMADGDGMSPYVYNTMDATLVDPMGETVTHTSTMVSGNIVLWTSKFDIADGARLRVEGNKPLIIASTTTIDIAGMLDVGSNFDGNAGDFTVGAGSEPDACLTDASGRGEDCTHGGAGGGGGGFGGIGGTGGNGAETHNDCVDEFGDGTTQSTGGVGGLAALAPTSLRGGCAGKEGGEGDGTDDFGIGAPGGGAVHLTAAGTLTVTGVIHAGGGGGRQHSGSRAAGGAGGSGGMIGIEASTIALVTGAVLSANGGGGGGGGHNSISFPGDDAPITGLQAAGGLGEDGQGTAGGAGGFRGDVNGVSQTAVAIRGGGGGGGAAGYILYYQDTTLDLLSAKISPAAIAGP